jgi:hypothetical protein
MTFWNAQVGTCVSYLQLPQMIIFTKLWKEGKMPASGTSLEV